MDTFTLEMMELELEKENIEAHRGITCENCINNSGGWVPTCALTGELINPYSTCGNATPL